MPRTTFVGNSRETGYDPFTSITQNFREAKRDLNAEQRYYEFATIFLLNCIFTVSFDIVEKLKEPMNY